MVGSLQVSLPLSWNHHHLRHPQPPMFTTRCALSKQGHRFLSSLAATTAANDPSATNRIIRKFIQNSSKSVALDTLCHLISPDSTHPHLSSIALPLYLRIAEASWFSWNSKLVADLIALLDKQGRQDTARTLISETVSKLGFRERDLANFYCNLIVSHSKQKSKQGFFYSYARLEHLLRSSSSVYVKRRAYESMVNGLCVMDLPREAENLMEEMRGVGLKPSVFEFRSVMYAYGRLEFFEDMKRIVVQMESEGFELDTICSNMVLSSFGVNNELSEMVSWLRRMKHLGVPFSIRTYNSVLNSCPTIMLMLQDPKSVPLSVEELTTENLRGDEALLVQELIGSSVLVEGMEWNSLELKLDLHGMHLGSAYLIMLEWIEELRRRFNAGNHVIPAEIRVVCGSGKHSTVRGESPVKGLVKEMMVRMKCPMRIDRNNIGCFLAKGRVVRDWLC
uniref:Smr domain-containing protein n=1 Tax=Davidia involucrata TaxID=16924 RepID=A0A5B6YLB4_DAVIN